MKTLSELRDEARSLFNETDSTNSHITNSQLTSWANEAYRFILSKTRTIPKEDNDITVALGDLSVSESTLTVDEAYIQNPNNADKYVPLEVIDLSYLQEIDPGWLSADASEPKYLVRKNTFTFYLYPQPATDWIGQNIRTYGMEFPTALSGDTDTPNKIPMNLVDAIPHFMAYRAFSQIEKHSEAGNELTLFRSAIKEQREISTTITNYGNSWRITETDDTY